MRIIVEEKYEIGDEVIIKYYMNNKFNDHGIIRGFENDGEVVVLEILTGRDKGLKNYKWKTEELEKVIK